MFVCVCSIPPTANCEGLRPSKHTLRNNIGMFILYRCVKTMAQMKTAMYCFIQHTHAPNSKNIVKNGLHFPTMQPSQPTAVTSVTIATMSDANYCKYCNYVGFVTTCNYCEYFANGGIHGVASLPAAFWNAGFTNPHFSRLPTIGPSVAIPNQSKSLIMVGCASSQHGFLRRLCI